MNLKQYKQELTDELHSILDYWMQHSIDKTNGGFVGKIDNNNYVDLSAPKGSVLNARILWAFSAAYNQFKKEDYLQAAARAFDYIEKVFFDKKFGGVFWTVDANGKMLDLKKQIYAQAFCIYGLSEYYAASKNDEALQLAVDLYEAIEEHSYDKIYKGYFEAFNRDWTNADDLRLSAKDANEKKTMNTHLHIIEAYANLYKVLPSTQLKNKITELLELFDKYFINKKTFHLKLFFNDAWKEKPDVISYGHDIEAAWLLQYCAEVIKHANLINLFKEYAVTIADAAFEGIDKDGGLWYEYDSSNKKMIKEKHWWPQAEAMIGFLNAYQVTHDGKYLQHSLNSWPFIKQKIKDTKNGEWFWGVKDDDAIMPEDKVGLWKCPYHNSRACLEIIQRINKLSS